MHRPRVRGRIWARAAVGLVLTWLTLSPHARAAEVGSVRPLLSVRPGATCLDRDELVQQLGEWLHDEPIDARYRFVVEGSALDPRTARLYVQRAGRTVAQRAFEPGPARCGELHAAVALALALAIKSSAREELDDTFHQEPERASGWAISAAGLSTYRLLPKLAPGVALAARKGLSENVSLRLGALGVAAFGAELEQQGRSYDAALTALRADGCASVHLAKGMRGGLCGGIWGGALYAAGSAAREARSTLVSWFALAGAAELEVALSARWSVELALALALPLNEVRVGITAADGTPVASEALPDRAWTAGIGPAYRF